MLHSLRGKLKKSAADVLRSLIPTPGAVCKTATMRSCFGNGRGFQRMLSIKVKIAVFAPIASPSVTTAVAANIGALATLRNVCAMCRIAASLYFRAMSEAIGLSLTHGGTHYSAFSRKTFSA
jgi:hypothetical protein